MHKRKAEVISGENTDGYPHNKKYKTNSNASSKQKTMSRASFMASLVGYDSKTKPNFVVGSKKVSLDFIKAEKPQPNPAPQAKYIDINPALVTVNKSNQKNALSKRPQQSRRDVTVNAIKKHLQIKGTVQTAGTIQKLRKSLCDWDQTQRQPQHRTEDDIISSPMLPPAPKQPRKPVVKRIEAFIYDSSPKQQTHITYNNNDSFMEHKNEESFDFSALEDQENAAENGSEVFLDDFSSPFIYHSVAPSTTALSSDQSKFSDTTGSLNGSSDDINSSPFALTMSFNKTQTQTQQSNANRKLKNSYDSLNSSPFVYNPTQATPGSTPANFTQKKFSSKASQISQLMDSQRLLMSSPFIYVGTQTQLEKSNKNDELKRSNDNARHFEDLTTQTESSENCSDNINSSPFIYLTAPSTNVNQMTQKSQRRTTVTNTNNKQEYEKSLRYENSEPSQKSKLSSQPNSQSDLEFSCSPDLFATQHK